MADKSLRMSPARRRIRRRVRFAVDLIVATVSLTAAVMIITALQRSGRPSAPKVPLPTEPLSIDGATTQGDPSASAVIIEYSEFQCPYCAKFARETLPAIKERYISSGAAQLAFRHLPLPNHSRALPAAASAICAGRQSRFWEMHDLLFSDQKNLDDASLLARGRTLGLDELLFTRCLNDSGTAELAKRDAEEAARLRFSGTPTFAIGTRQSDGRVKVHHVLKGAVPFAEVEKAMDSVLAQSRGTDTSAWASAGSVATGVGLLGMAEELAAEHIIAIRVGRECRIPEDHSPRLSRRHRRWWIAGGWRFLCRRGTREIWTRDETPYSFGERLVDWRQRPTGVSHADLVVWPLPPRGVSVLQQLQSTFGLVSGTTRNRIPSLFEAMMYCSASSFCCFAAGVILTVSLPTAGAPQVVTTITTSGVSTAVVEGEFADKTSLSAQGAISGIVTDGVTGQPLSDAFVRLLGGGRVTGAGRPGQITDARGRFIFTHLPAYSDYVLSVSRRGYMSGGYNRVPGLLTATRLALRDGEWLTAANVKLWRPSSVSGIVRDEHGDPVIGVPVRALLTVQVAGHRVQAVGPATETDDRGMYRLGGLQPGVYVIQAPSVQITLPANTAPWGAPAAGHTGGPGSATAALPDVPAIVRMDGNLGKMVGYYATPPPGSSAQAYAMAFHSSAQSLAQATSVSVSYGDQIENIDVRLTLVPTVSVSGRVTGPAQSVARLPVRLVPVGSESLAMGADAAFTQTNEDGGFTFLEVPAGDYTLIASRTLPEFGVAGSSSNERVVMPESAVMITSISAGQVAGSNGLSYVVRSTSGDAVSGRLAVSVGARDLINIVVPLTTGVKVSGYFLWDGSETPPDTLRQQPGLRLEPADGDISLGVRNRTSIRPEDKALPSPLRFELDGVLPGRYLLSHLETAGFSTESAEWNGRDLLTTPLDVDGSKDLTGVVVRLSSKRISVTGSVQDASGGPARSGAVLTFPASPALWRNFGLSANLFRTSTIVSGGTYRVDRMVPGDYLMVAVPDGDRNKWVDPEFLASVSGLATRLHVEPGASISQNLKMIGGKR